MSLVDVFIFGVPMVQSFFPDSASTRKAFDETQDLKRLPQKEWGPGLELALPLTLLAFIFMSEQSPMLKMHMDTVLDWLCAHDLAANVLELSIAAIPFWMIAVMIKDKIETDKSKKSG
ncbi:MAG: hypothetical protein K2X81_11040 [Candidatus Obscuribacterales bacterium]|nr:hypothetical protein [Candidatus Obscuribacterales bacterium]